MEIVGLKEPTNFAVVATFAVMLLFFAGVLSNVAPAIGAEVAGVSDGHGSELAKPGERCKVFPLSKWTQSEKWAWMRICEAQFADFNGRCRADLFDLRDGEDDENLSDRNLSSSFLETILLHEPFRSAIPRQGVRIIGANFPNRIELSDASIHRPLILQQSRFESKVELLRLTTLKLISFQGSILKGELNMNSATVGGDLIMGAMVVGDRRMRAQFKDIVLEEAKIGGQIDMTGSKFKGKLDMNSATVGSHLFMREESEFDEVNLRGAKIGGQIDMTGSEFKGKLDMNAITVGGSLIMREDAEFNAVDLRGAKIGGQIDMTGSEFKGELNMSSATVKGHLFMRKESEFDVIFLREAKIGGQIDMTGSKFNSKLDMNATTVGSSLFMREESEFDAVDLRRAKIGGKIDMTGSTFEGEIIMDYIMIGSHLMIHGANFKNSEILSLRHTNVGTLQDDENVWPDTLNLDGFTYERLGGMDGSDEAANRGSGWFKKWLAKNVPYSPQPYRHLASVLRAAGHNDMANAILVASRDREREESSMSEGKWWRLTLLKFFIGYGYGNGNFWALIWALALVAVGTIVLYCTKEHKKCEEFHHWLDPFFYSLDMLLPIIRLRERHYKNMDLKTRARYYFYFHQVMGYVLIFFVIAGLSGLTS